MREVIRFTVGFYAGSTSYAKFVVTPFTSEPVPDSVRQELVRAAAYFSGASGEATLTVDEWGEIVCTNINKTREPTLYNRLWRCASCAVSKLMEFREQYPREQFNAAAGCLIAEHGYDFIIQVLMRRRILFEASASGDEAIRISSQKEHVCLLVCMRDDLWREAAWMGLLFARELEVSLWLAVNYIVADEWSASRFAPQQYLY